MTFREFRGVKENERQSRFVSKSSKKRKTEEKTASEKMVNIKVGMMTYREDHGGLKVVRGGHHTILVSTSSDAKEMRLKAVEKHSRFNRSISNCAEAYYLLYPDMIPVEKIPGTVEDFILYRYKQELGKPFDRITLFLCTTKDYLAKDGFDTAETDSDSGLEAVEGLSKHASTSTLVFEDTSKRLQKNEHSGAQSEGASTSTCYSSYINLISDSEEEEDQEVMHVNNPVKNEKDSGNAKEYLSLLEIVAEHVGVVMPDDDDYPKNLLNVRRKHCFKDAVNKLSRPSFIPSRKLSVRFADNSGQSEGAVDLGGPTREFLRLAIAEMFETSGMFGGMEKNKSLIPNSQARALRHYFLCGKLIAVSLCNGGVAGNCLSKPLYQFLVNGEEKAMVTPNIEDIPDYESRIAVVQLQNADSEAFPHALENMSGYLEQCGYSKPHTFLNREDMVKELCHFFVVDNVRSAIEQFKEGLGTLDILSLMRRHPQIMEEAFCAKDSKLEASDVVDLFMPRLDEPGSNKYDRQELILMHWRDYLQDCEAGCCNTTLGEVLSFVTGSDEIPPLGFRPQPQIRFWEDVRPKANTCGNTLYLPLFPSNIDGNIAYEAFKENMDDGILNSPSFGLA